MRSRTAQALARLCRSMCAAGGPSRYGRHARARKPEGKGAAAQGQARRAKHTRRVVRTEAVTGLGGWWEQRTEGNHHQLAR